MSDLAFGLKLPNCGGILCPPEWATPESMEALAGLAESYQYDSVWFQDHLLSPAELRHLGDLRFYEPLITAAALASRFPSLSFGIATIILPLREPVLLAKQMSVFDAFFPGRLKVGFGTGRYESEFESFGTSWSQRGATADDYLDLITALLSEEEVTRSGARTVTSGVMSPRPDDVRRLLWVGGTAAPVLRRTVRYASGWICAALAPDEVAAHVGRLHDLIREDGGDPGQLRVALSTTIRRSSSTQREDDHSIHRHSKAIAGSDDEISEILRAHVGAGVTDFLVTFDEPDLDGVQGAAAWFASDIVPDLES